MFKPKEIIKCKINISVLLFILLSFCTQVFAQQQDFIKEGNFGKLLNDLNELMNVKVFTDISQDISLYGISTTITVFDQLDTQQLVHKTNPEIPWTVPAINLTDYDLYKWAASILGLYNPHPEKSDIREVSSLLYSDELLSIKELNFDDVKLIEALLASQESLHSQNPLMGLVWQISENIDVAIVGQYTLDMTYPDFVDYMTNEEQKKSALYAKLTLRF